MMIDKVCVMQAMIRDFESRGLHLQAAETAAELADFVEHERRERAAQARRLRQIDEALAIAAAAACMTRDLAEVVDELIGLPGMPADLIAELRAVVASWPYAPPETRRDHWERAGESLNAYADQIPDPERARAIFSGDDLGERLADLSRRLGPRQWTARSCPGCGDPVEPGRGCYACGRGLPGGGR